MASRARRHARWAELGRRTALTALVAASGVAGVGAAMLPESYPTVTRLAPMTVMMLPETNTVATAPGWGQPLQLHCMAAQDNLIYCVLEPQ